MRNVLKWLLSLYLLVVLPYCASAHAQQYVRPSNGAAVTISESFTLDGSTTLTSSAFGFSGFSGATIRLRYDRAVTLCAWMPQIEILGAETSNGTFSVLGSDHATYVPLQSGSTTPPPYFVQIGIPFIKVRLSSNSEAGSGGQNCVISVTMSPLAISSAVSVVGAYGPNENLDWTTTVPVIVGGRFNNTPVTMTVTSNGYVNTQVNGTVTVTTASKTLATPATTPVSVTTSATLLLTTNSTTIRGFNLQNVSSTPVYCGVGNTTTTTRYSAGLTPDSVGGSTPRFDGGTWTEDNITTGTAIYCITASGTASVAVTTK